MKTRALIAAFALSAIVLGSGVSAFAYNGYHNNGTTPGCPRFLLKTRVPMMP